MRAGVGSAQPRNRSLFEQAQKRTLAGQRSGSVTASRYSVPRPASSKRPARAIAASVKAPRSWPKQFGLHQRSWKGGTVDGDEGFAPARTGGVEVAGEGVLADAGFAGDEHCGIDGGMRSAAEPA